MSTIGKSRSFPSSQLAWTLLKVKPSSPERIPELFFHFSLWPLLSFLLHFLQRLFFSNVLLACLALLVTLAEHAAHAPERASPQGLRLSLLASVFSTITGEEGNDVHSSHKALDQVTLVALTGGPKLLKMNAVKEGSVTLWTCH